MLTANVARVEHWNGFILTGIVTGGDHAGIFVQAPNKLPIFCDFRNVKSIHFNQAAA